ncbi:MAG: C_GCAxxG_C_C family protein [bacterium]|nr:C_GCAxxG_C_C family protein [bacterium]
MNNSIATKNDAKKLFLKLGTCSQTFFHILNREYGHLLDTEERASDPLCGGMMGKGCQCGMLWGAVLAVGAESFRRYETNGQAIAKAVTATQHLMASFKKRTGSVDCRDVTHCDLSNIFGPVKLILFKSWTCLSLSKKWAPEAIQAANEGLALEQTQDPGQPISCACEVAKKMGASDEETASVAGFAGGMGLSGNACGALGAAVWLKSIAWAKVPENSKKSPNDNPKAKETLKAFYAETGSEILCEKISGRRFKTMDDHTEFIKNGGCEALINVLAGL